MARSGLFFKCELFHDHLKAPRVFFPIFVPVNHEPGGNTKTTCKGDIGKFISKKLSLSGPKDRVQKPQCENKKRWTAEACNVNQKLYFGQSGDFKRRVKGPSVSSSQSSSSEN